MGEVERGRRGLDIVVCSGLTSLSTIFQLNAHLTEDT